MNREERDSYFILSTLTVFSLFLWISAAVSAAPPSPKISEDRRNPLSEQLLDPPKEWRRHVEPKSSWRSEEPLTKGREKKDRIENKRFKPYYYDPEKEGDTWDPYSLDRNPGSKPATIFRFQF